MRAVGIIDKTTLVMQAGDVTPLAQAQAAGPIYIQWVIRVLFPCSPADCSPASLTARSPGSPREKPPPKTKRQWVYLVA